VAKIVPIGLGAVSSDQDTPSSKLQSATFVVQDLSEQRTTSHLEERAFDNK
jgi:hypothetical protein